MGLCVRSVIAEVLENTGDFSMASLRSSKYTDMQVYLSQDFCLTTNVSLNFDTCIERSKH
jgi:hypothetical protein